MKRIPKNYKYGRGQRVCRRCGTHRALIRRYNLNICRRCFREVYGSLGFHRYE